MGIKYPTAEEHAGETRGGKLWICDFCREGWWDPAMTGSFAVCDDCGATMREAGIAEYTEAKKALEPDQTTQAYAVAEELAKEFVQKTMGMSKEEIWEAADLSISSFTGVQELLDNRSTLEHLLACPAYGNPVWSNDNVDESDNGEGRSTPEDRLPG